MAKLHNISVAVPQMITDDNMIDHFPADSQQHTFQPLLFAFPQRKEVTTRFIDQGTQKTGRFLMALGHIYFLHDSVAVSRLKGCSQILEQNPHSKWILMLFRVTGCLAMEISGHRAKAGIFTVVSKFQNCSHYLSNICKEN